MTLALNDCLVVGISSRSLFDLEKENEIFENSGVDEYRRYQRKRERRSLKPGTGFPLIEALLKLNQFDQEKRLVEVVVMSRNSPDTGLRIFNSIEQYQLDISRAAFTGGESLAGYLKAFSVDLFLSKSSSDVKLAIEHGIAAATVYDPPAGYKPDTEQIRIAFDGDAVIFSDEAERVFQEENLDAFIAHERKHAQKPLPAGPFAKLLKTLSFLQQRIKTDQSPIRLALVTARNSPAHERAIATLRSWEVFIDEAFFLGGLAKDRVLEAFHPHIFFDDQEINVEPASKLVPSGHVPSSTIKYSDKK